MTFSQFTEKADIRHEMKTTFLAHSDFSLNIDWDGRPPEIRQERLRSKSNLNQREKSSLCRESLQLYILYMIADVPE